MQKVILFGASGNLGKKLAHELVKQGYDLTVVTRNKEKLGQLSGITRKHVVVDVSNPAAIFGICRGFDIVVSALGKSVSPNDKSDPSFRDVDLIANSNILTEAKMAAVRKFVYISALHSERHLHLEYFRVHHEFSERLKTSGLNYSIIKPPAFFSAFADLIDIARKGRLVNIGEGSRLTNPIYEGDLARICVNSIQQNNVTIEAGGKKLYTRKELNDIIQKEVAPNKKVRTVPLTLFKSALPIIKFFDDNSYQKFAFFSEVIQHDTIAPQVGEMFFEDYVKMRLQEAV